MVLSGTNPTIAPNRATKHTRGTDACNLYKVSLPEENSEARSMGTDGWEERTKKDAGSKIG